MMKNIFYMLIVLLGISANAQYEIKPAEGYSNDIGNMIAMLDDLKGRMTRIVSGLDQKSTDFLLDENANSIGAMIMHLAATEVYYQKYTLEGRQFNEEEHEKWGAGLTLGDPGREKLKGQPITYYLKLWDEVRDETKRLLKEKDDKWFSKRVGGMGMNNHWAWFHVMEHQANHIGQVRLLLSRIPD